MEWNGSTLQRKEKRNQNKLEVLVQKPRRNGRNLRTRSCDRAEIEGLVAEEKPVGERDFIDTVERQCPYYLVTATSVHVP